jgi:hypothetical protein
MDRCLSLARWSATGGSLNGQGLHGILAFRAGFPDRKRISGISAGIGMQ